MESLGQSVSDTYEEEGFAYMTGQLIFDIILAKGISKVIPKGPKAGSVDSEPIPNKKASGVKVVAKSELRRKLDYVFGKATGTKHNIDRSIAMENSLKKIGIFDNKTGRELLEKHLTEVINDSSNIKKVQDNGRVVRESLLTGPNGVVKVESVWDGNRLITITIFGG